MNSLAQDDDTSIAKFQHEVREALLSWGMRLGECLLGLEDCCSSCKFMECGKSLKFSYLCISCLTSSTCSTEAMGQIISASSAKWLRDRVASRETNIVLVCEGNCCVNKNCWHDKFVTNKLLERASDRQVLHYWSNCVFFNWCIIVWSAGGCKMLW